MAGDAPHNDEDLARNRRWRIFISKSEANPHLCVFSGDLAGLQLPGQLKIETPPCHFAGVVARQTRSANIRSHGIDSARRQYAYLSYKCRTAITAAAHAPKVGIDISAGD
jgi:hypothetical protein